VGSRFDFDELVLMGEAYEPPDLRNRNYGAGAAPV
jgi:hypothetical protein